MHFPRVLFPALLAAVCPLSLYADRVTTSSGAVLVGTIESVRGGKIYLVTDFAGTLAVDRAKVTGIEYTTDRALFARRDASVRDKVAVKVGKDAEGNPVLISEDERKAALSLSDVSTLWDASSSDPDFPPVKLWSFSASVGLSGHSGSKDETSLSVYADAVRTTSDSTLKLYASMTKNRADHETTAEQYIGGLDFEQRPWERHSWYVRDEAQRNKFSDYALRNVLGAGYGYYVWNENNGGRISRLRLRAGFAHTYIDHYDRTVGNDSDIAVDFGLLFHYDFTGGVKWNTEITYTPLIDEPDNGVIVHETKISYILSELSLVSRSLSDISLDLGMRNEHQTKTEGDVNSTDTTWYLRLSKSW